MGCVVDDVADDDSLYDYSYKSYNCIRRCTKYRPSQTNNNLERDEDVTVWQRQPVPWRYESELFFLSRDENRWKHVVCLAICSWCPVVFLYPTSKVQHVWKDPKRWCSKVNRRVLSSVLKDDFTTAFTRKLSINWHEHIGKEPQLWPLHL